MVIGDVISSGQQNSTDVAVLASASSVQEPHPLKDLQQQSSTHAAPMARWQRRLNTRTDKFSLHKLSSATFVVSSAALLFVGALNGFNNDVPDWAGPLDFALLLSTLQMCFSSIFMANTHRRSNPTSRDTFHSLSWALLATEFVIELFAPFQHSVAMFPNKLMVDLLVGGSLAMMEGYNLYILLFKAGGLIESRRTQNDVDRTSIEHVRTLISYFGGPMVIAIPTAWIICLVVAPSHDMAWITEKVQETATLGNIYYSNVVTSMTLGYIAFAVTLHDKKLISKEIELVAIVLLTLMMTLVNAQLMV